MAILMDALELDERMVYLWAGLLDVLMAFEKEEPRVLGSASSSVSHLVWPSVE